MMQTCFAKKKKKAYGINSLILKGLKNTNLQMFIVPFSIPAPNVPIIHGPKLGFEIPFWWVWMVRFWHVDLNSGD